MMETTRVITSLEATTTELLLLLREHSAAEMKLSFQLYFPFSLFSLDDSIVDSVTCNS